jgi:hypothetical protein
VLAGKLLLHGRIKSPKSLFLPQVQIIAYNDGQVLCNVEKTDYPLISNSTFPLPQSLATNILFVSMSLTILDGHKILVMEDE